MSAHAFSPRDVASRISSLHAEHELRRLRARAMRRARVELVGGTEAERAEVAELVERAGGEVVEPGEPVTVMVILDPSRLAERQATAVGSTLVVGRQQFAKMVGAYHEAFHGNIRSSIERSLESFRSEHPAPKPRPEEQEAKVRQRGLATRHERTVRVAPQPAQPDGAAVED